PAREPDPLRDATPAGQQGERAPPVGDGDGGQGGHADQGDDRRRADVGERRPPGRRLAGGEGCGGGDDPGRDGQDQGRGETGGEGAHRRLLDGRLPFRTVPLINGTL